MGLLAGTDKKLNILFVRFGTTAGIMGGGITRLLEINRCLRENVNFFIITHKATFEWLKALGLKAGSYFLEESRWTWRQDIIEIAYCGIRAFLFLRKRKDLAIDWVYAFTNTLPDLLPALKIKYLSKARLAVYIQLTVAPRKGEKRDLANFILVYLDRLVTFRLMKRWADVIFVFNSPDKEELMRKGIEEARIKILNYGVDTNFIKSISEMPKKYDGVFLGRLTESKGFMDLVDIWKFICIDLPEAKLAVVGGSMPVMVKRLEKKIAALGMSDNIFVLGPLYGREKYQVLKASKIFLNPSYLESWCITICESLACGVPVVAYDLDVYRDIYNGSIITVPKGDTEALAERAKELLRDPVLYNAQREKGLELSQKYDWELSSHRELDYLISHAEN